MSLVVGIGKILRHLLPDSQKKGLTLNSSVFQARALGAASAFISALGYDEPSLAILTELERRGLDRSSLSLMFTNPYGRVMVTLDTYYFHLYTINECVTRDAFPWSAGPEDLAVPAGMLSFSGPESHTLVALLETHHLNLNALTKGSSVNRLSRSSFGIMMPRHSSYTADIIGAGNVFMSALVTGMLRHNISEENDQRSRRIAVCLCSLTGTRQELKAGLAI